MKFCVFGAGAIGGYVAAHLAQVEGVDVSVVARGDHLAAIADRGLRLEFPRGLLQARVRASDRPVDSGPQDVVFVALKSHQVAPASTASGRCSAPRRSFFRRRQAFPTGTFMGFPAG